jgi:chromosome segregation ATPase
MKTEPIFIDIPSAGEPVSLDEVAQWIESDRKWIDGQVSSGTGHRLEMMTDAAEALIKELRELQSHGSRTGDLVDQTTALAQTAARLTAESKELSTRCHAVVDENERLKVDVANWKLRAEQAQGLLANGGHIWEATIRDRDHWKVRAETAENEAARLKCDRDEQNARAQAAEAKLAKAWAILPCGEAVLGGKATDEQVGFLHGQRSVWRQIRNALKDGE